MFDTLRFCLNSFRLNRIPRKAPEQVMALQKRRLHRIVQFVIRHSPFYRDKYRGIDPRSFELADLPPTNKREIMAHFDQMVTDPAVRRVELEAFIDDASNLGKLFKGRFAVSHTSGSQGQPILLVQDRRLFNLLFGIQMTRGNAKGQTTPAEAIRKFLYPARLAVVMLKRGFYPSASTFEYMPKAAKTFVKILRLSQTDPDLIDRLQEFQPTVLTAYAGVLETLAKEAEAGRLNLNPHLTQVVNNSEMLSERARLRIESAFRVRVMDNYATGECTFLSNGCPTDHGAHVNADWAILEVVDEHYQPVPDGTPGKKVLITNLANTVQPFVRYEVDDVLTMSTQPCRCGNRLPRIERIDGRASDALWIHDGIQFRQVPPYVFKKSFLHTREVREWQAVQYERNRFKVRLELLPGAELDEERAWKSLHRYLDQYGFRNLLDIQLEVVPALTSDPVTGKFRHTLSLIGPPSEFPQTTQAASA